MLRWSCVILLIACVCYVHSQSYHGPPRGPPSHGSSHRGPPHHGPHRKPPPRGPSHHGPHRNPPPHGVHRRAPSHRCGPNSHWTDCPSMCPRTCQNPSPGVCVAMCAKPGCQCDIGYVKSNRGCIRRNDCPRNGK